MIMIIEICFLLFISMVVLAIFGEIEKMRRAFDRLCSFTYRWYMNNLEEEEDEDGQQD